MSASHLARLALASLLSCALPAMGDCTPKSAPWVFEPAAGPKPGNFSPGFTNGLDLYRMPSGERRLLVTENYGYAVFSLANPAAPSALGYLDMSLTIPLSGDGQSLVVGVAAAPDGSRALVNWKQSPYGTFLMKPNAGATFGFAGNFPSGRAPGGLVVDMFPARSLAYALTIGGLYVADVTTFMTGASAVSASTIPAQQVLTAPVGTNPNHLTIAGHYLVYSTGTSVVVVDASSPGAVPYIANFFTAKVLPPTAFGLGSSDQIVGVAAALHPLTGALVIVAEGANSRSLPTGIGIVSSADAVTYKSGGLFRPPSPYGTSGMVTGTSTLAATATDLLSFTWEYANGSYKLVTLSAAGWGRDLTPDLVVDPASLPQFSLPQAMRAFTNGDDVYAYVAAQQGGVSFSLSCAPVYPPGDVDGDGLVANGDVFALINFLFSGAAAPVGSGDVDGNGTVDVHDVFALVNYLYAGGPPPAAPPL